MWRTLKKRLDALIGGEYPQRSLADSIRENAAGIQKGLDEKSEPERNKATEDRISFRRNEKGTWEARYQLAGSCFEGEWRTVVDEEKRINSQYWQYPLSNALSGLAQGSHYSYINQLSSPAYPYHPPKQFNSEDEARAAALDIIKRICAATDWKEEVVPRRETSWKVEQSHFIANPDWKCKIEKE